MQLTLYNNNIQGYFFKTLLFYSAGTYYAVRLNVNGGYILTLHRSCTTLWLSFALTCISQVLYMVWVSDFTWLFILRLTPDAQVLNHFNLHVMLQWLRLSFAQFLSCYKWYPCHTLLIIYLGEYSPESGWPTFLLQWLWSSFVLSSISKY